MKRKRLRLGNSDFKTLISENAYYIDKSLFIEELLYAETDVMLIPRPRRFGKTLNLSMLKYFFDKTEPENIELFKELNIWKSDEEIKEHCCKYPVISISFKDVKANTWEKTFLHIQQEIIKTYRQHRYLLQSDTLFPEEIQFFNKIIDTETNEVTFELSLKQLSEWLHRYHGQKVVILVDEYDVPIQAGYNKFYDEAVAFMRNLLSGAFKDNIHLFKGVITGILRVSRESIFSGLNNLSVHTTLDSKFSDKFGFVQSEVDKILNDFELTGHKEEIKKWYNGYKFGKTENIYNPWSILSYVVNHEDGFKTFWSNTSANELIKEEIKNKNSGEIREDILKLINGETIVKDIEENFIFPYLKKNKELIWTLLTHSGYLTVVAKIDYGTFEIKIPNYELKLIFKKTILEWFNSDIKIRKTLLEETTNALINNNLVVFEKGFKQIMGDTFSYYDTAENKEYVYHSYMLGILAIIGDDYIIKSNRESGTGRYDIMLIPHDKTKNGVVMEIKQIDKFDVQKINKELKNALLQIDKNQYYKELLENNIPEKNIVKVPVVFAGKEAFVLPISK